MYIKFSERYSVLFDHTIMEVIIMISYKEFFSFVDEILINVCDISYNLLLYTST